MTAICFPCECWYFLHTQCPPVGTSAQYRGPLILSQRHVHTTLCRLACAKVTRQAFLHCPWVCSCTLAVGYFPHTVMIRHGIGCLFSAHTSSTSWHIHLQTHSEAFPSSISWAWEIPQWGHSCDLSGKGCCNSREQHGRGGPWLPSLASHVPFSPAVGSLECTAYALWWIVVDPPTIMTLWVD